MIAVHLRGGLGNQMFQYALYLAFKAAGKKAGIDISHYKNSTNTSYELQRIFGVQAPIVGPAKKIFLKAGWQALRPFYKLPFAETDDMFGRYNNKILRLNFAYLKGYWQCEQYFLQIAGAVRQCYNFPEFQDEANINILNSISNCNAVSLHVRRGDYLKDGRNDALDAAYYNRAVEYFETKLHKPVFYIFSDDAAWAATNIKATHAHYINWNTGAASYQDMQLMSRCKHHIIANSSFSWWGAWLNTNPEKIVVAPAQWLHWMDSTRDIIPAAWVTL
ncbi:MAG TPA: alpha-1,2-fucosyltransferase [Ferruginibacter sp.]|nr:alpha-1,2-fucosyltransferase [Ferruginibacter sp.]HMP19349.1 alpha-1,2-fucosyltransferase [Ferruginibacter sp.]